MAKKSNIDRFNQLYKMCILKEDVTENFNSERTAKAEYHKMLDFSDWLGRWINLGVNNDVEHSKDIYEYYCTKILEGLSWEDVKEKFAELYKSEALYKKRTTDCLSVENKRLYYNEDESEPHYGFHYGRTKIYSGKYIANCVERTKTRKRQMISEWCEIIGKVCNFYGVYSSFSLPTMFTIYTTQPTADDYAAKIGFCKSVMNGESESKIKEASEKQINLICRKTGLCFGDVCDLNNVQCSELIDILLNWDENKGAEDPVKVLEHYSKIIGKIVNLI